MVSRSAGENHPAAWTNPYTLAGLSVLPGVIFHEAKQRFLPLVSTATPNFYYFSFLWPICSISQRVTLPSYSFRKKKTRVNFLIHNPNRSIKCISIMTHAFIVFPLFYERLSLLLPKSNSSTQPPALEFIFWLGRVPGPQVIHFTLYFVCSLQPTNMFFKKKKKKILCTSITL